MVWWILSLQHYCFYAAVRTDWLRRHPLFNAPQEGTLPCIPSLFLYGFGLNNLDSCSQTCVVFLNKKGSFAIASISAQVIGVALEVSNPVR